MKQEIEGRFNANLARVQSLIGVYASNRQSQSGRGSLHATDLLRAAVVLLHATLEDLLRSLQEWKLPAARADVFKEMNLVGTPRSRFTLEDVAQHRGKSVDELIRESVLASLERSNFNNTTEVAAALERVSLTPSLRVLGADLEAMMQRRHLIVHRADRNTVNAGSGTDVARALDQPSVEGWLSAVESLGKTVLAQC